MSPTALCPDPGAWRVVLITLRPNRLVLHVEPMRKAAPCPLCGAHSARVHSRYQRMPWDLPWGRWPVQLIIYARRFFCDEPQCVRRIFSEPFPHVLPAYARHTERLSRALLELSHAGSAEGAARVARLLGCPTSPDTLIRRQRQEWFPIPSPRALGVDEFSLKRGSTYATILVDLERHRPVDVVEERKAEPVARWLGAHPGVEVLARDRAGAYALAGRTAAPDALQVTDRFHLVRNVIDALKELLRSRRWVSPDAGVKPTGSSPTQESASGTALTAGTAPECQPTPSKQARWEAVQQRKDSGQSALAIARELGMDRHTVGKYLAAERPPVYPQRRPRVTQLTPHLAYLQRRWAEGCHNARRLYQEITGLGYTGSERSLRAAVRPWRSPSGPLPSSPASSLPQLLLRSSSRLTDPEREELQRVLEANPWLARGYRLKESFQQIVALRDVSALASWVLEAAESGLHTFQVLARSFGQDYEAIRLALITPWSTAQCEGQICRVKLLKRMGYGRAKPDLLRQRVLHRVPTT